MFASLIAIMAAAAAATSDAPAASGQTASSPPATQAAADDSQKVVCHYEEVTGSRFKKRVCHTKAQWQQLSEQAEKMQRDIAEHTALVPAATPNQ